MKTLVLLSGGMDSVTALHWAHRHHDVVGALSFHYGSKHNDREIPFAKWQAQQLGIPHVEMDLGFMNQYFKSSLLSSGEAIPEGHYAAENMKSTVVPFRNGIMLSVACGYAESLEAEGLIIAAHGGDHAIYPDCREPFMAAMGEAMRHGTYTQTQLLRPFIDMDKGEIAKLGQELGVDYAQTYSCYKGAELHCGLCGTCVERKEAFKLAGVPDPTHYLA